MKTQTLIAILYLILGCGGSGGGEQPRDQQWQVVWEEQFDGEDLDARWEVLDGWMMREPLTFSEGCVHTDGGLLHLEVRPDMSSGGVHTLAGPPNGWAGEITYGRVTVRALFFDTADVSQTIWLCGGWPDSFAEAGLVEYWGGKEGLERQVTFGERTYDTSTKPATLVMEGVRAVDIDEPVAGVWHEWQIEWTPEHIIRRMDWMEMHRRENCCWHGSMAVWLDVEGSWQSTLDPADLPRVMLVDWVRYERLN